MKTLKKISVRLFLFVLFFMSPTNVFAGSAEATKYINTVYALMLCEQGSTLSTCTFPLVLRTTPSGTDMDIGSVNAGAAAGSYGNLNVLKPGVTYTYGQVVLDRTFQVAGSDGSCQTNASGSTGSGTDMADGKAGSGTSELQTVEAPDSTGNGDAMNSTANTNESTSGDAAAGTLANGDSYMKFRWKLAKSYTYDGKRVPQMKIAFDLSTAINFNGTCGSDDDLNAGITPASPSITNTIE